MRLLVRLPNWIGDVVMATPALRALRAAAKGDEIAVLGRPGLFGMLEASGWYDRAIPLPGKEGGLLAPIRLGRALARDRFDVALLFPNSWSSVLMALAARIPRRIGYAQAGRGLLLTRRLHARRIGRLRPTPMADYYLSIVAAAGIDTSAASRKMELPTPPAALERAAAYHRKLGLAEGEKPVALNPGAAFGGSKRWTVAGWAGVIDHFVGAGRRVLIYGGPGEKAYIDELIAAAKRPGAVPVTDVPLGDLCSHMKLAAVLVSTDSGGRHFGVAAGTPTVVVMGSTHPQYSENDAHDNYAVIVEKVECWPCHLKECPIDHRCMTRIGPERPIAAAEDFLAGRKPFGGAKPWVTPAGTEGAKWKLDGSV